MLAGITDENEFRVMRSHEGGKKKSENKSNYSILWCVRRNWSQVGKSQLLTLITCLVFSEPFLRCNRTRTGFRAANEIDLILCGIFAAEEFPGLLFECGEAFVKFDVDKNPRGTLVPG